MTADRRDKESEGLAGYSPPLLKPKGPMRWLLFVGLNLAAFTAGCGFWQYLRSGRWVDFTAESFRSDLAAPMGQMLLEPLSIFTHPWMIAVTALMLALLIAVPLATAVMYPMLLSMLFVAVVAVVGHSPWLALALVAGCLLAARTRLRREYPFLAGMMGLLPVGVYLYLLTYAGIDASLLLPLQRWILAVPFLLAIVLAVLAMGLVVLAARMSRFQPGVIWPAILLLFPTALGLFSWRIGPGELQYSLLTGRLAPGSAVFRPVPRDQWIRQHGAGLNEQTLPYRILDDLRRRKDSLAGRCDAFLSAYPHSRRSPAVAYLRAQCRSVQLESPGPAGKLISYTAAFCRAVSAEDWRRLMEKYPQSDQQALARWNLGLLELRKVADMNPGDAQAVLKQAQKADKMLRAARDRLRRIVSALHDRRQRDRDSSAGVFSQPASLPGLQDYEQALFAAEVLTWKIARNDVLKDSYCAMAMARLIKANPFAADHARTIKALAADAQFQMTSMADNLQMTVALLETDPYEQAEAMIAIAADERMDSAIKANYELGRITMQTARAAVMPLMPNIKTPVEYFQIVVAAPPNPWQGRAAKNLAWLKSTTPGRDEP